MSVDKDNSELEYEVGEGETETAIEIGSDDNGEAEQNQEEQHSAQQSAHADELDNVSEAVQKRISKLTARMREAERREQAALEYAKANIRVNSVCPGVIKTAMVDRLLKAQPEMEAGLTAGTPLGRMGKPEEIAEAVVWLCSDAASYVSGHNMAVDGAFTTQ